MDENSKIFNLFITLKFRLICFWIVRIFGFYRLIINNYIMNCHCHSKELYKRDYENPQTTFKIDNKISLKKRKINQELIHNTHPFPQLEQKIIETAQMWLPTQIQKISWDEIRFNPLWFYQKYMSKNVPCVITDVFQGDDIFQRWAEPQYLTQVLQNQKHSISLTPDGFADSINGEYFIEPHQQKANIKQFFNHEQHFPNAIPYIQHQNGNLFSQFQSLSYEISQDVVRHVSEQFFKGRDPEAQNLWLGYDKSVSSLHKDHYQNFYISVVGQKHFTLMPPHSILFLEQQEYKAAKWNYSKSQSDFTCSQAGYNNRWICVNPDLKQDVERFQGLKKAQPYHVVLNKEEMLYLPSLWYHQVSQLKGKDPHVMAINYWFDMQFTQNFSLYQTCRSLRNLK